METQLPDELLRSATGRAAEAAIRKCVHCGFCNATCPSYQVMGDELDGPRGRIYQIKQLMEGKASSATTQLHLDRCLNCYNCETTCPSGVQYRDLIHVGRAMINAEHPRHGQPRWLRWLLLHIVSRPRRFALAVALGQLFRPLLPAVLRSKVPGKQAAVPWAEKPQQAKEQVLLLSGCVQPSLSPATDANLVGLLHGLDVEVIHIAGCCGALAHHTDAQEAARDQARQLLQQWRPHIESGAKAIVMSSSGCQLHLDDYPHLLADDPDYAELAKRAAALVKDPASLLSEYQAQLQLKVDAPRKIAFHPPCSLQHGLQLRTTTERLLTDLGFELQTIKDAHLCCGSAGAYSLLQADIANKLRTDKVNNLQATGAQAILSANIGCQQFIADQAQLPVSHWLEWLELKS